MNWDIQQATSGSAVAEIATLTHEGKAFTALGSVVDHASGYVCGYVTKRDGREVLTSFDGAILGTLRLVSRRLKWCFGGSQRVSYYQATVGGREYHGRKGDTFDLIRLRAVKDHSP